MYGEFFRRTNVSLKEKKGKAPAGAGRFARLQTCTAGIGPMSNRQSVKYFKRCPVDNSQRHANSGFLVIDNSQRHAKCVLRLIDGSQRHLKRVLSLIDYCQRYKKRVSHTIDYCQRCVKRVFESIDSCQRVRGRLAYTLIASKPSP